MNSSEFFENIVEPSTERLALFGIAHDVAMDGRSFVVSHKISKNVLTEFDRKLSRYLSAITGMGLPLATIETRIRDLATGRSWSPYPARYEASVPDALLTASKLALGGEQRVRVRLGAWMQEERDLELERSIGAETTQMLEEGLRVCRYVGSTDFLEISCDFDRILARPIGTKLDMMVVDMHHGSVSIPTASELAGTAFQGPIYGFEKAAKTTPAISAFLGRARHAISVAKEDAVMEFREIAEDRILRFNEALGTRELSGHRLETARTLVARLKAGLGDSLLGLSEEAQMTALDWAYSIRSTGPQIESKPSGTPPKPSTPRLVS